MPIYDATCGDLKKSILTDEDHYCCGRGDGTLSEGQHQTDQFLVPRATCDFECSEHVKDLDPLRIYTFCCRPCLGMWRRGYMSKVPSPHQPEFLRVILRFYQQDFSVRALMLLSTCAYNL